MIEYPVAVIVGFEQNGLGISRTLYKQGIQCIAVSAAKKLPTHSSRSCIKVVSCDAWTEDGLIKALLALGEELKSKAPLLLTKDEAVLWVSTRRDELSKYFYINLPDDTRVQLLMSKVKFLEYALIKHWPVPITFVVGSKQEFVSLQNQFKFPCIIKPAIKNSDFRYYASAKAYTAATLDELEKWYDYIAQWEKSVVIQEWVEGGDDKIVYCLAYYSRDHKPLAMFAGRKIYQYPIGCGNTAIAAPAPDELRQQILDISAEIFHSVGFQGLGSIEYKVRSDNSLVIMEPTVGRTNWQNEIAVLNGVNIPYVAYLDTAGLPAPAAVANALATEPVKLVNELACKRLKAKLKANNTFNELEWSRNYGGRKQYMLWRSDDPAPYLVHHLKQGIAFPKRLARKLWSRMKS